MIKASEEFAKLLTRVREGDQTAIIRLVELYEPEIRIVARARLGNVLRPYLDSVDLVQSVHRSLLAGLQQEKYDISSPDRLVALASTMVRRKIARQWRRAQRQVRLEKSEPSRPASQVLVALTSTEADPADRVALEDQVTRILDELPKVDRRLLELRLEGCTTAEAARELRLDADVLRVRLSRLRRRLREEGLADECV